MPRHTSQLRLLAAWHMFASISISQPWSTGNQVGQAIFHHNVNSQQYTHCRLFGSSNC